MKPLVAEYNQLLPLLPQDPGATSLDPLPSDLKELNDISLDDRLWQLETSRTTAKWAIHPQVRSAIAALDKNERSFEEAGILTGHAENFVDWIMKRMGGLEDMIFGDKSELIARDSPVGRHLLMLAMKAADSLRTVGLLKNINLDWVPEEKRSTYRQRLEGWHPLCAIINLIELVKKANDRMSAWDKVMASSGMTGFSFSNITNSEDWKPAEEFGAELERQVEIRFAEAPGSDDE